MDQRNSRDSVPDRLQCELGLGGVAWCLNGSSQDLAAIDQQKVKWYKEKIVKKVATLARTTKN